LGYAHRGAMGGKFFRGAKSVELNHSISSPYPRFLKL
jgi:hypothetical protein